MAGDRICAHNMVGERIELCGGVAKEVCKGDGRKRMGVGVGGAVGENHCHKMLSMTWYSIENRVVVGCGDAFRSWSGFVGEAHGSTRAIDVNKTSFPRRKQKGQGIKNNTIDSQIGCLASLRKRKWFRKEMD